MKKLQLEQNFELLKNCCKIELSNTCEGANENE